MASISNSLSPTVLSTAQTIASAPAHSSLTWKIIGAVFKAFKALGSLLLSHYVHVPLLLAGGTFVAHKKFNVLDPILNIFLNQFSSQPSSPPSSPARPERHNPIEDVAHPSSPQGSPVRSHTPEPDTVHNNTPEHPSEPASSQPTPPEDHVKPPKKPHKLSKKPKLNADGTPKDSHKKIKHSTTGSLERHHKISKHEKPLEDAANSAHDAPQTEKPKKKPLKSHSSKSLERKASEHPQHPEPSSSHDSATHTAKPEKKSSSKPPKVIRGKKPSRMGSVKKLFGLGVEKTSPERPTKDDQEHISDVLSKLEDAAHLSD